MNVCVPLKRLNLAGFHGLDFLFGFSNVEFMVRILHHDVPMGIAGVDLLSGSRSVHFRVWISYLDIRFLYCRKPLPEISFGCLTMTEWIDRVDGLHYLSKNQIFGQMLQSNGFNWFAVGALSISNIDAGD